MIGAWRRVGGNAMKSKQRVARAGTGVGLVAFLLAFGAAQSHATTLVNQGNTTVDTVTGLQWLDLPLTVNHSYNDILANYVNSGQLYEGYRYATANEVRQLFTDAGIDTTCGETCADPTAVVNLLSLLGATVYDAADAQIIYGLNGDAFGAGLHFYSRLAYWASTPIVDVYYSVIGDTENYTSIGSFLVKDVDATPLPASLPMFLGGLSLIGLIARRRKQNRSVARGRLS
jgi:hypothetical protein